MEEHKGAVRMFEEFMGSAVPVWSITRQHVIAYKQALLETPTRYTIGFKGLTLPQAIKANKKRPEPYYEQGVPVFDMREASKNRRSKRLVSIHSDLFRLGL